MKSKLENLINSVVEEYCGQKKAVRPDNFAYDLHPPKDTQHGDLACNVAFKLAKVTCEKPAEIAAKLAALFEKKSAKDSPVEKIEIAGGGFINLYLRKEDLGSILIQIHEQGARYGASDFGRGKKVILEFVSANPTGPLTIAHGRQAAVGDCLAGDPHG